MTLRPEPKPDGWAEGTVKCASCQHEWVAVRPTGIVNSECPACGLERGIAKHNFGPANGTFAWRCNCGCEAFYITPEKTRCYGCGAAQNFG